MGKDKKVLKPMVHKNSLDLISDGKSIKYFECVPGLPLQIEATGKKTLRILTRLQFSDSMGQEDSYRIRVSEGTKVLGTYYFNTERSPSSQIEKRMDRVPGKWRSCEVDVPKGKHRFNVSLLAGGTPLEIEISIGAGYDDNAMRFSDNEISEAAQRIGMMGGAKTFDSFITKWGISALKELMINRKKSIKLRGFYSLSDYRDTPEKRYWSGGFDLSYRWGSYRNIKYSIRHLDEFYLRHYIDRDISVSDLAACVFTDRNQNVTLTHRLSKLIWINISPGYLQRYYSRPFTEFDLDIVYLKGRINYKLKNIGSVALQINRGKANNISYSSQLRPSSFDRSYETVETFIPIKVNKNLPMISEIGVSLRTEYRVYEAEDVNDPLHSGRSHMDSKYDIWLEKKLTEDIGITLTSRYRSRTTDSSYNWVNDLKSFKQLQFWFNIEWDLIYDKY